MAIFCTKCGTKNEDGATFCENCGAALRAAPVAAQTPAPQTASPVLPNQSRTPVSPKKAVYAVAALCAVLVAGGAAVYFVQQPPAATSSSLIAAAKDGYGDTFDKKYKNNLCIANMDYAANPFNAAQGDATTRAWLDALVKAGLYSPAVETLATDVQQAFAQYQATPELAKWRKGRSLCAARGVEIANVTEIQKPAEEPIGRNGGPPTILAVKATFVLQTTDTAPWMATAEVRDVVLGQLTGWTYQDAHLQRTETNVFGLRDGKWATGPAYAEELSRKYLATQQGKNPGDAATATADSGLFASISASLSKLFSFGGHPLNGTWRMDTEKMGEVMGIGIGSLKGMKGGQMDMTFTSNTMEIGGQLVKCTFEVDGKRVKVMPEGQPTGLVFVMLDSDTAKVDLGLMQAVYKRVK